MASQWYTTGLKKVWDAGADNLTFKVMLLGVANTTYVFNPDHAVIDTGGNDSGDLSYCELQATNYTGGFAGADRNTVTITSSADLTNDRLKLVLSQETWTTLGNGSNDTIVAAAVIWENSADTDSIPIIYFDHNNITTNGNDVSLLFDQTNGNAFISV